MSKKQLERQKIRDTKHEEDIKSGKAKYICYEERKRKKAQPNHKSKALTPEEEMEQRQEEVENVLKVYRCMIPDLLKRLEKIKEPRQPEKVKHKLTVVMLYGILLFIYQVGSRRNANKGMTSPILFDNIKAVFPELESIPHADTLARLLERIEVEEIQSSMIELLKSLMKSKKFRNLLINRKYLVAVDGSQKFFREYQWQVEALKRRVGEAKTPQYYVYTLDVVLVLDNGAVLPVITEILDNKDWIEGQTKQDSENKAFKRLAPKLLKIFGKGKVTILGDGLYANGPVMEICRKYKWDFMLVLKENEDREIWVEANSLIGLERSNIKEVMWGNREQTYQWANDIEYEYGVNRKNRIIVNVVICYEKWEELHVRSTGKPETKETRYAWISSVKLTKDNVFRRCTKMARYRWKQENNFLIEKHEGYFFEHCYSYNWQAMKGFHYLMKIGHFINVLLIHSEIIEDYVDDSGIRGFIGKLYISLAGAPLDKDRISHARSCKFLWRLKPAG